MKRPKQNILARDTEIPTLVECPPDHDTYLPRTVTRVTELKKPRCYPSMTSGRSLCAWPSLLTSHKEEDDNPQVPTSKDRRQESVAGPKSEEMVPFLN